MTSTKLAKVAIGTIGTFGIESTQICELLFNVEDDIIDKLRKNIKYSSIEVYDEKILSDEELYNIEKTLFKCFDFRNK